VSSFTILSKLNHLFLSIPTPNNDTIKTLNRICYNFILLSYVDKMKRETINQDYSVGGLKMFDLKFFRVALKTTWDRTIINCLQ